ncbi:MAG: glycosyltransferase [Chloroflexota bacterium]|nr:glycosyltransferase [Chloroflexota bacterium]
MSVVADRDGHWPRRVAAGGLLLVQAVAAARVIGRLVTTHGGKAIRDPGRWDARQGRVAVVVPVLNEQARLAPCLQGLIAQGPEVAEVLVVDGGSTDGTRAIVNRFAARDPRARWIDASPVPPGWNGKAWGLQVGFEQAAPEWPWLLTIDADVRPRPGLARALVAHAAAERLASLSAATLQKLSGAAEGMLHPAMLATLVYRFGSPGGVARRPGDVQANGQCALFRRDALARYGGFGPVRASRCEDVTIARLLVAGGERIGFVETEGLVAVRMYANWQDAWRGWARSLPMRDRFTRWSAPIRLAEATLVQALPLPIVLACLVRRAWGAALLLNGLLLAIRLGILAGMARAYPNRPWTYWLSPLVDVPVAAQLWASLLGRRHTWRGRPLVAHDGATDRPSAPLLIGHPSHADRRAANRAAAVGLATGGVA